MPLNSAEVAASIGQFQQMYVSNNQYSNMVGGMGSLQGPPGVQAEQITGGLMNRGMTIGAPLASLGMGLMGMDPLSIGLKAGMGAYGMGAGIGGAAALGMGAAAGVAIPMAAAGYAANQMWTGAQQQQTFNQQMRGAFHHMTPFGQGFSGTQMGQINQGLYNQAGQQGPGGEVMGMRELSGLAANMGRMGQATGVRDVQQFSQRFREMVDTLKVVAKEMGTSLQSAQEFVVAMKGSGIFNSGDQRRLATEIRQFSQSGNLATSELAAVANIGAQVSRAIGGRGRQGAFAGIRTLGTIGSAVEAGILSEEDIYNATGMTGAEGRQALATRQLEQSGNFLKSGRGRMFLASVAGAGGTLDPASVQDWLTGGMGIGETRGQARGNLAKVGRAGFLRQEGRLRGAALQQFGGMLPAMALQQWASSKGIDINEMDDRSMLFASRQLGMGMDELEDAMKMSKNMPRIAEQQRSTKEMGDFQMRMSNVRRTQGIGGVQTRFEQAREKVQGSLQRVGAQFYSDMSEMVERYLNEMTGVVAESYDKQVSEAYNSASRGAGTGQLEKSLGVGAGAARGGLGGSAFSRGGGIGGGMGGSAWSRFSGAPQGALGRGVKAGLSATPGANWLLFGNTNDLSRMKEAGYGSFFRGAMSDDQLQKQITAIRGGYAAAAGGGTLEDAQLGQSMRDVMRNEYAVGGMQGAKGAERVDQLARILSEQASKGNQQAAAALKKLQGAGTPEERLRVGMGMLGGMEAGAGIPRGGRTIDQAAPPGLMSALGGQGFATEGARAEAVGASFLAQSEGQRKLLTEHGTATAMILGRGTQYGLVDTRIAEHLLGRDRIRAGLAALPGIGGRLSRGFDVMGQLRRGAGLQREVGEYLLGEEGKALVQGIYSKDAASRKKVEDQLIDPATPRAKREALKTMLAGAEVAELYEKAASEKRDPTPRELNAIQQKYGGINIFAAGAAVNEVARFNQGEARSQLIREKSKAAMDKSTEFMVSGFATRDAAGNLSISADVAAALRKGVGTEGGGKVIGALTAELTATGQESRFVGSTTNESIMGAAQTRGAGISTLYGMSARDLAKARTTLQGQGQFAAAQQIAEVEADVRRVGGRVSRGGGALGLAGSLGLGTQQLGGRGGLRGLQAMAPEAAAAQLLQMAGLNTADFSEAERKELGGIVGEKDRAKQVQRLSEIEHGTSALGSKLQKGISEAGKKTSESKARDENPLMDKMEKHLEELVKALTAQGEVGQAIIKTSNGTTAIVRNTMKEKDEEGDKSTPAPKP